MRHEPLDVPHRQQRVLVDRILMIKIARHFARDFVELEEDSPKQTAVAHLAQARRQARPRVQELHDPYAVFGVWMKSLGRIVMVFLLPLDERECVVGDRHIA